MSMRRVMLLVVLLAVGAVGVTALAAGSATTVLQAGQGNQWGQPQGPPPGRGQGWGMGGPGSGMGGPRRGMGGPGLGMGGPGGIGQMLSQLTLTTAQREQVRTLLDSQREAESQYQDQFEQFGDQMKSLVQADTFDEAAVRALALKQAAAAAELHVIRARTESRINQLLTADQNKQLATLQAQPPPRGRGGRLPNQTANPAV